MKTSNSCPICSINFKSIEALNAHLDECQTSAQLFEDARNWLEVQNIFYARSSGIIEGEEFWKRLDVIWNRIGKKALPSRRGMIICEG